MIYLPLDRKDSLIVRRWITRASVIVDFFSFEWNFSVFCFFKLLFGRTRSVDYILTYIGGPTARSAAPHPAGFCFEKKKDFRKKSFFVVVLFWRNGKLTLFPFQINLNAAAQHCAVVACTILSPISKRSWLTSILAWPWNCRLNRIRLFFVLFWSSQRFFSIWIFGGGGGKFDIIISSQNNGGKLFYKKKIPATTTTSEWAGGKMSRHTRWIRAPAS